MANWHPPVAKPAQEHWYFVTIIMIQFEEKNVNNISIDVLPKRIKYGFVINMNTFTCKNIKCVDR